MLPQRLHDSERRHRIYVSTIAFVVSQRIDNPSLKIVIDAQS